MCDIIYEASQNENDVNFNITVNSLGLCWPTLWKVGSIAETLDPGFGIIWLKGTALAAGASGSCFSTT